MFKTLLSLAAFSCVSLLAEAATTTVTAPQPSSTSIGSLSCPGSDGSTVVLSSGSTAIIECFADRPLGDAGFAVTYSLDACINLCTTTVGCRNVAWLPGTPGYCYLKNATTGAVANSAVWGARLTAPSTGTSAPRAICPASDGLNITTTYGYNYTVECGVDRPGSDIQVVYQFSLDSCVSLCTNTTGCVDVSWVPSGKGVCYLKNALATPVSNANVWGARLVASNAAAMAAAATAAPIISSLVNFAVGSTGCGVPLSSGQTAGGSSRSIPFTAADGTARSYLVYIPTTYNNTVKTPLVLAFHGAGDQAGTLEAVSGFSQPSNNRNSIVVYPQGINGYWQGAPYANPAIDDISYTQQLVASLTTQYCVDLARVYATGFSNGGGFVGTLSCNATTSNIFAAFGAQSGAFYPTVNAGPICNATTQTVPCAPGRSVIPFIEFHGTADGQIPYYGGVHNSQCLPAVTTYMTYLAVREGYSSINTTVSLNNSNYQYLFGTSAIGQPGVVQHYAIDGLGHAWASNYGAGSFSTTPIMLAFLRLWTLSTI